MKLFFVYRGDVDTNVYVARLSQLSNPKVEAAFPTRVQAVAWALSLNETSTVVVERGFSLQNGDDNNLISYSEWNCRPEPELPPIDVAVVITGEPIVGLYLKAMTTTNNSGQIKYQWTHSINGIDYYDIAGANAYRYQVRQEDLNRYIGIRITQDGYNGDVSAFTTRVKAALIEGNIYVIGNPVVGNTLGVDTIHVIGTGDLQYQWQYKKSNGDWDDIFGADRDLYKLTHDDIGKNIRVTATMLRYSGKLYSDSTPPIEDDEDQQDTSILPPLTGEVSIDGNLQVGESIVADITSLDGFGVPTFQWIRAETFLHQDGSVLIPGSNSNLYTLTDDDENMYISVIVSRDSHSGTISAPFVGPIIPA